MRELKTVNRGIRLTPGQCQRLATLAGAMGVKPNRVIGHLIDSATTQTGPVGLSQKNSGSNVVRTATAQLSTR